MVSSRLLLVDDHALFREGLAGLFAYQADFDVVGEAGDADTALAQTAELKPDIIVMNIDLPGEHGIAATRRLKTIGPTPKRRCRRHGLCGLGSLHRRSRSEGKAHTRMPDEQRLRAQPPTVSPPLPAAAERQPGRGPQDLALAAAAVAAPPDARATLPATWLFLQRRLGNRAVDGLMGGRADVLPPGQVPVGQQEQPEAEEPEEAEGPEPAEAEESAPSEAPESEGPMQEEEPERASPPTLSPIVALSRVRPARRAVHWGAAAGIEAPRPVSWAGIPRSGGALQSTGAAAVGPPTGTSVLGVQKHAGSPWALGWTFFPTGFKAPNFAFNSADKSKGKGPAKWFSSPKLTQKSFEGNGTAFFVTPGTHKTAHVEGGLPVFWIMPAAMSKRDRRAEQEHVDDTYFAYRISLKEADAVLRKHVAGHVFGPKATQADAENLVLAAINTHLTHKALGTDKTKWGATYDTLFRKTLVRDNSAWHTFALGNRKATKTKVTYRVNKGTTNIATVPSSKIIKY